MRTTVKILTGIGLVSWALLAAAQSNLGELLDAGAKRLSAEDFKRQIVQRLIVGQTPLGGDLEVVYAANGGIQGRGANPLEPPGSFRGGSAPIYGEWKIGEGERICTEMRISQTILPARCQDWYRLGDAYFISDSDTDRHAKVFRRTIKSTPTAVATPSDLGQLLDAGGKRLSGAQFKQEVVQRALVGAMSIGGNFEIMYVANGSIQAQGGGIAGSTFVTPNRSFGGEWTIDATERVCINLRGESGGGGGVNPAAAASRCEVWFKLGDEYYVADSDTDRRAKILRRTIKPTSIAVATPENLGQLLDAGGKKLSLAEFKRDVAQRVLVATMTNGAGAEIMYAVDGSIQGLAQPSRNYAWIFTVSGDWTVIDGERVCTSMQFAGGTNPLTIPRQCQSWFKLGDAYYVADSDTDRRGKVFRRALKQ